MSNAREFLPLFLQHENDLRAFIASVTSDFALRDDLFQETAVVLWERFDEFDRQRSFGAWARGIASNKILKLREQGRRLPGTLSPELLPLVADAFNDSQTEGADHERLLLECLASLPSHARDMLSLRYVDGIKPRQLAERFGRTVDAIYQILSRLRSRLEDCVRVRRAVER